MNDLILRVKQVRQLDQDATHIFGIPTLILMENAGRSCAEYLINNIKNIHLKTEYHIFCGSGNNGGDGFVIARHLFQKGKKVKVVLVTPPEKLKGDALVNFNVVQKLSLPLVNLSDYQSPDKGHVILVDAILGTGFQGSIREPALTAINIINTLKNKLSSDDCQVIAIDIPSGMNGDSGPMGHSPVKADHTLTFVGLKQGMIHKESASFLGKINIIDIGVPKQLLDDLKKGD